MSVEDKIEAREMSWMSHVSKAFFHDRFFMSLVCKYGLTEALHIYAWHTNIVNDMLAYQAKVIQTPIVTEEKSDKFTWGVRP